jgi:hypothetical protein
VGRFLGVGVTAIMGRMPCDGEAVQIPLIIRSLESIVAAIGNRIFGRRVN